MCDSIAEIRAEVTPKPCRDEPGPARDPRVVDRPRRGATLIKLRKTVESMSGAYVAYRQTERLTNIRNQIDVNPRFWKISCVSDLL